MLERQTLAALTALVVILIAAPSSWAQPSANSLVPGISPYEPKAAPAPPAAKAKPAAGAPRPSSEDVPDTFAASEQGRGVYSYHLGAGDKLRITVFGEDGLTGEFFVAGDGDISFPLIGQVPASGKTIDQVQGEITSALSDGYLKDPRVSAEVLIFRPYYILGEVTKPGEYPYSDGITVLNAVATAGGFTYRANTKYIFLKKPNEASEHKVRLTDGLRLEPGERVRIVERYF